MGKNTISDGCISSGETIACLQGVQAAIDIGARQIVLETDAMLIQQAITSKDYASAPSGILIYEIQELASLNFMTFNVNVVPRIYNRVAHALAAQGCEASEDDTMVMNIVPPCIQSLVADDRTAND
jgi:ribonuclease HI